MSAHTPGPYRIGARVPERHAIRIESAAGLVAEARGAGGSWDTAKANAKLFRAAPKLADALEAIVSADWDDFIDLTALLNGARAALRAAGRLP